MRTCEPRSTLNHSRSDGVECHAQISILLTPGLWAWRQSNPAKEFPPIVVPQEIMSVVGAPLHYVGVALENHEAAILPKLSHGSPRDVVICINRYGACERRQDEALGYWWFVDMSRRRINNRHHAARRPARPLDDDVMAGEIRPRCSVPSRKTPVPFITPSRIRVRNILCSLVTRTGAASVPLKICVTRRSSKVGGGSES